MGAADCFAECSPPFRVATETAPATADPVVCGENHSVSVTELILSVLDDVEPLMVAAFDAVGGTPPDGSSLDQVYLLDGREIVVDFLQHGEPGLAFDHLVYMIAEPPLAIGADTYARLSEAAHALGIPPHQWAHVNPSG